MGINPNFRKLPGNYLFSEVAHRVARAAPDHRLISLGIGDVTLPLPEAAADAMADAAREMRSQGGFHGYGPEQGYEFLRSTIAAEDYHRCGVDIKADEIFVSDGTKTDCGGILDLFDRSSVVALCDPVYPAYVDAAAIGGLAGAYDCGKGRWDRLVYLPCTKENRFFSEPPAVEADVIYLCCPNNPTGAMPSRAQLTEWVRWANKNGAVLLYDGAYTAYISDPEAPRSIFEISGAHTCAIEFRSFSKTAGFTGVRCAYMVIPRALERGGIPLRDLWSRRLAARCNGASYIVQRGAEALYSSAGQRQVRERIEYYMKNAATMKDTLTRAGLTVFGGTDAPYLWVKTPNKMDSWTFFDILLHRCGVVTTPGVGFGPHGEGYIRLTAFGRDQDIAEAMGRIKSLL